VLQLFEPVPLRAGPDVLDAGVVPELLLTGRLHLLHVLDLVDVLPYQLAVPQGLDLLLQQLHLLVLLLDDVLQGFYVGRGLLEQSSLLHPPQLHFFVGELVPSEDFGHVGDDALVVLVEGLPRFREFEVDGPVGVVAEHGVLQAAVALE
jgi:hypothetical protein